MHQQVVCLCSNGAATELSRSGRKSCDAPRGKIFGRRQQCATRVLRCGHGIASFESAVLSVTRDRGFGLAGCRAIKKTPLTTSRS